MNCKCGSVIPQPRVNMGYKTCVNCSTESKWTAVPLIFHKTGNTTQVIKDPEVAADLMFMSSRKGFGVMKGMTSSRRKPKAVQPRKKKEVPTETQKSSLSVVGKYMPKYFFEEVGDKAVSLAEKESIEKALHYIEDALVKKLIFKKQAEQIKQIILFLTQNN